MPLRMPAELRFAPPGSAEALDGDAMADLLAIAKKIQNPLGYKSVLETFKSHFGRSIGEGSSTSSSVDWAVTCGESPVTPPTMRPASLQHSSTHANSLRQVEPQSQTKPTSTLC